MRELQAQILQKSNEVKTFMADGEGRDLDKAEKLLDEIDELQKEFDLEERAEKAAKAGVPDNAQGVGDSEKKANGFQLIAKLMHRKPLSDTEKTA
jgi:hypothetical protein